MTKRRSPLANPRGLTLAELLVVTAIFSLLMALLHETFRFQSQTYARESAHNVTQRSLRVWLARMVKDIRRAGYDPRETNATDPTPDFVVQTFTATEFRFTADTNGDGDLDAGPHEHLGYRLSGEELQMWQGGTGWRPVLFGVQELAFQYLDANGNETSCVTCLSAVSITITAEAETGGGPKVAPPRLSESAVAKIRNLVS